MRGAFDSCLGFPHSRLPHVYTTQPTKIEIDVHPAPCRLRECAMGCFSVFLCDAQARARMYMPDAEELGLAVNGATGWGVLTHYAQQARSPETSFS